MTFMGKSRCVIISLLLSVLSYGIETGIGESDLEFFVFWEGSCAPCEFKMDPLINIYGEYIVDIYNIRERSNLYLRIVDLVGSEISKLPVVGIYEDKKLIAIVSGHYMAEGWDRIVRNNIDGLPVYAGGQEMPCKILTQENLIESLERLFRDVPTDEEPNNVATSLNRSIDRSTSILIPLLILAALAISIILTLIDRPKKRGELLLH